MNYVIKNWRKYQHYKDRNPPWVKLHVELLSSKDWVMLDDASRVLAIACIIIASKSDRAGEVPGDPDYLKRVAYLNKMPNFNPLIECGFLECASDCKQMQADARPETEAYKQDRSIPRLRKSPIPEGWKPNPKTIERLSTEFGFTNGDAERYAAAFVDACKAKGYQYQDFEAAFSNCVRKDWPGFRAGAKTMPKKQEPHRPSW